MVSILLDLLGSCSAIQVYSSVFLLLDRMFSACQLGLTVLFRSSSFLLGAGFLFFFSVHFWNRVHICNYSCGFVWPIFQRMSGLDGSTNSVAVDLSKLRRRWRTRSLARCSPWGRRESDAPEQPQPLSLGRPYFARRMRVWMVCPCLSLRRGPSFPLVTWLSELVWW